VNREIVVAAPKALLHDHLDGGLRPQTVIELAADTGYAELPASAEAALAQWFRESADSGALTRYLETFDHTVAVMQTPDALYRVARE
jgi:adenosine deaminase